MAWCHQAPSHYLNQCWPRSTVLHSRPKPLRVNSLPLGDLAVIIKTYFQSRLADWYHEYFLWNFPQMNATIQLWLLVNIGSGNGLVLSGDKPLHKPMLIQIHCSRKTLMFHLVFVQWTLYILFKCVKSFMRHLGLAILNVWHVWWFLWTLSRSMSLYGITRPQWVGGGWGLF